MYDDSHRTTNETQDNLNSIGNTAAKYAGSKAKAAGKNAAKAAGKKAAGAAGRKIAAVGTVATSKYKLGILAAILAGCILMMPVIMIVNTANVSFNLFTHTDEDLMNKDEKTNEDVLQDDVTQKDLKYASIISEYMLEDYDRLEEVIRKHCEAAGVDYEASSANIADNTCIPLIAAGSDPENEGLDPDDFISKTSVIAQALTGEKGKTGNTPGDQTGTEVFASDANTDWKYIYRPTNKIQKLKIAKAALQACENSHVGYDQAKPDRGTLYKEANMTGWDISRIDEDCETSCSGLLTVCLRAAGFSEKDAPKYIYANKSKKNKTLTEVLGNSKLRKNEFKASSRLYPGDILYKKGDIAIVVTSPNRVNISTSEFIDTSSASGGTALSGKSRSAADVKEGACLWAEAIAKDNSFHYGLGNRVYRYGRWTTTAHANGCYFCDTNSKSKKAGVKDYKKSYCCNPFVHAAFAHGGGEPEMLKICKRGSSYGFKTGTGYDTSHLFRKLKKGEKLERGDVLCTSTHVMLYLGNGKIAHAAHSDDNKKGSKKWNSSICISKVKRYDRAYRYTGNGGGVMQDPGSSAGRTLKIGNFNISLGSGNSKYRSSNPAIQGAINWAVKIANDNSFTYGKKPTTNRIGCYFCGTNQKNKPKGYEKTYVCMTFITAAYAHGANDPEILKVCKKGKMCLETTDKNFTRFSCWERVGNMKNLSVSDLEPGDVLVAYSHTNGGGKVWGHMSMYLGNGDIVDASGGGWGKNSIAIRKNAANRYLHYNNPESSKNYVMRYKGSGKGTGNSSEAFPPQSKKTTIETVTSSTGKRVKIGYPAGGYACAQSFAAIDGGDKYGVAFSRSGTTGKYGYIQVVNSSGKTLAKSSRTDIYHANGSSSTPNGTLLVAGSLTGGIKARGKEYSYDGSVVKSLGSKSLPRNASAIAYDRETGKYIISEGSSMRIYNSDLKKSEKTVSRSMHGRYYQDVGAGCGYIFACHTKVKGTERSGENYVDIYNEGSGKYCGTIYVNYGELESADVVNGELVLLVHILGNVNYIQYTGIRVTTGGTPGIDLEALAATRDMASVISAFSVYEAQILPALEFDEDPSLFELLIGAIKNKINRDLKPPFTLKRMLKKALKRGTMENQAVFFNVVYADPVEKNGKKVYPLIEINPASSEQLAGIFKMDPKGKYVTEAEENAEKSSSGSRSSGKNYAVGDTNIATAIETNTDTHLELLYDSLEGKLPPRGETLVLPIKNLFSSIKLTKTFKQDKRGIECVTKKTEKVHACERGTVKEVKENDPELGNYIKIEGEYEIIYAHLSSVKVKKGDIVDQNRVIGKVKGLFRLEVYKNDTAIDPEPLFIKKTGLFKLSSGDEESGNGNEDIVEVARKEMGATNGNKYRKWYTGRADGQPWCATFVSWCANQCGFIDSGIIPKFALCSDGSDWFKARNLWKGRNYTPKPGDIVFFDWDGNGDPNHVGIVEYAEGNKIHTLEGNTTGGKAAKRVRNKSDIMGYGTPKYPKSGNGKIVDLGSAKFGWPVPGHKTITSKCGWRQCPYHGKELHSGVDIAAPSGTKVYAAEKGTVTAYKNGSYGGYGNCVVINHGKYKTAYAHLSKISVKSGQTVKRGQFIGKVGSTGNSTGPHLHFSLFPSSDTYPDNNPIDPLKYTKPK